MLPKSGSFFVTGSSKRKIYIQLRKQYIYIYIVTQESIWTFMETFYKYIMQNIKKLY